VREAGDAPFSNFDDGVLDEDFWFTYEDARHLPVEFVEGQVSISPPSDYTVWSGVYSFDMYTFRECAVSIEVPQVLAADAQAGIVFDLQGDPDNYRLDVSGFGGQLTLSVIDDANEVPLVELVYDAAAHRVWRLRESGGFVYFETFDGQNWTTHNDPYPTPDWADNAYIDFSAGSWDVGPDPGAARFDNVNLPPQ
jgi:hypothetical protein